MLISIPLVLLAEVLPHGATFPDDEALCRFVAEHYRLGVYLPVVRIEGDAVLIEFDAQETDTEIIKFSRIAKLAETGSFAETKRLLGEVLVDGATDSEIFRNQRHTLSGVRSFEEYRRTFIGASMRVPEIIFDSILRGFTRLRQQYCERLARARGVVAVNC